MDIEKIIDNMSEDDLDKLLEKIEAFEEDRDKNPSRWFDPTEPQSAILSSKKPIKAFIGGNSSGKTYVSTFWLATKALGYDPTVDKIFVDLKYKPVPVVCWACTVSLQLALTVLEPLLERWIGKANIKGFKSTNNTLYLNNGSTIVFKSYDSNDEVFQSAAVDYCLLDEQPRFSIWQEVLSRVSRRKGEVMLSFSPLMAAANWTYEELLLKSVNPESNIEVVQSSIYENKHLDADIIKAFEDNFQDEDDRKVRLMGNFLMLQGLVHKKIDTTIVRDLGWMDIVGRMRSKMASVYMWSPEKYPGFEWDLRKLKFVRVSDLHPRAACSTSVYGYIDDEFNPLMIQIKEIESEDTIQSFAELVLKECKDIPIEFDIVDSPESNNEADRLGTSLRTEFSISGIAGMEANRSFEGGKNRTDYFIGRHRLYILADECPKTLRQFHKFIYGTWARNSDEKQLKEVDPNLRDSHFCRNMHYAVLACLPALDESDNARLKKKSSYGEKKRAKAGYRGTRGKR